MPAITAELRRKLYILLALLAFVIFVLAIIACALPMWSVQHNTEAGLWQVCDKQDNPGWTDRQCTQYNKVTPCDGWYQAARVFAILAICFALLLVCAALACAMQAVITKAIPALVVCLALTTMLMAMMAWVSWLILRGSDCQDTHKSMNLGTSFILEVIAFCLAFFALCLALYLFASKILVPAPVIEEKAMEVPAEYYYPAANTTPVYAAY